MSQTILLHVCGDFCTLYMTYAVSLNGVNERVDFESGKPSFKRTTCARSTFSFALIPLFILTREAAQPGSPLYYLWVADILLPLFRGYKGRDIVFTRMESQLRTSAVYNICDRQSGQP